MIQTVEPNTVCIVRNAWKNGTIVEVNLREKGELRVFWADEFEIQEKSVSPENEISEGQSVCVVEDNRKHVVAINFSKTPICLNIEFTVSPPLPFGGTVSATSGF